MACQTKWTRQTCKLVSLTCSHSIRLRRHSADALTELDALGLDDDPIGENETPAYLQDAQVLPDFVDSAPVEEERAATPTAEAAR